MDGSNLKQNSLKAICVFCGSRLGTAPEFADIAQQTGALLAKKNITLVYGGGRVGLMGEVAMASMAKDGKVIGVIPEFLEQREVALKDVNELIVVPDMHQRKRRFLDLSDAFIALPGGIGTLEEVTEVLSWFNLNLHNKPLGLVNTLGYFDPFLQMLKQAVDNGFLDAALVKNVHVDTHIELLLDKLQNNAGYSISDTILT